jgi:hypothetical protein
VDADVVVQGAESRQTLHSWWLEAVSSSVLIVQALPPRCAPELADPAAGAADRRRYAFPGANA